MRLADHMLAARGLITDLGSFASSMSRYIQDAQRFEIGDEVARACGELIHSRPSALAAALPLCRLPYETMWLEWRGGIGTVNHRGEEAAPTPERQGMLIESYQQQRGFMTLAWVHTHYKEIENGVNISPIAIYFDWRPDGDVRDTIRAAHGVILDHCPPDARPWVKLYVDFLEKRWLKIATPQSVSHLFTGLDVWKKFVNDPREIEAIQQMDRHMLPGLSFHGAGLVALILSKAPDEMTMRHFMQAWEADIQGEATFVECFLAMLNSRNPVVEHQAADLTKLNRARVRRGKPEFLPYNTTRLVMSRSQQRIADAHGVSREAARQHLVRGHFKIRSTGVFWWAPFLRGDPLRGTVKRQQYEVT